MLTAPCGWVPTDCPGCDIDSLGLDPALVDVLVDAAADMLWRATGRVYGDCQVTVTACGDDCRTAGCGLHPYRDTATGVWRNVCGCGGACGCGVDSQISLDGPVAEVVQVTVDGDVLAPTDYRVDDWRWLVRTDGGRWPTDGTVDVTYIAGLPVPPQLSLAHGRLACELAKACAGQPCRLPFNTTSVSRRGVTVDLADIQQIVNDGRTGIFEVDLAVASVTSARPLASVSSPDVQKPRMQTWP